MIACIYLLVIEKYIENKILFWIKTWQLARKMLVTAANEPRILGANSWVLVAS